MEWNEKTQIKYTGHQRVDPYAEGTENSAIAESLHPLITFSFANSTAGSSDRSFRAFTHTGLPWATTPLLEQSQTLHSCKDAVL